MPVLYNYEHRYVIKITELYKFYSSKERFAKHRDFLDSVVTLSVPVDCVFFKSASDSGNDWVDTINSYAEMIVYFGSA